MKTLRVCNAPVKRKDILKIIGKKYFPTKGHQIDLTSDMIPEYTGEEGISRFVLLSIFEKAGLLKFQNQKTLIQAVLREETCSLSVKGKFIWSRVNTSNY